MTEDQKRRAARRQALRFRIWAFCEPRGWNVTVHEIAEHLDVNRQTARSLIQRAGWYDRIRVPTPDYAGSKRGVLTSTMDNSFSAGAMLAADIRRDVHGEA